jgi:hypothetical protein
MFIENENLGGVHLEVHGEEEEHKVVVLELSLHVHHSDSLPEGGRQIHPEAW